MNHEMYESLLPLYAAGQLSEAERADLAAHLITCTACRADLELWQGVAREIRTTDRLLTAPPDLAERALKQAEPHSRPWLACLRAWELLRAQTFVVQREMWPATAAVMALGVIVAVLSGHTEFVYFVAPMAAAASLAMLTGQENDPAYELTIATPTSPWKILLARLSIVSAYNLLLALAAILALLLFASPGPLGALLLGLLAPMAFLSALALLLSQWMSTGNAVVIAYVLWVAQYVTYQSISNWVVSPTWAAVIAAYRQFWQNPILLLSFSLLILAAALWSANRPASRLNQQLR